MYSIRKFLERIQRSYVDAGSDIIYANTFGANAHKLEGTGHTTEELVAANVAIAKKAADGRAKVALDVGPIGELMERLARWHLMKRMRFMRRWCVPASRRAQIS